jgi:hypothetical protein
MVEANHTLQQVARQAQLRAGLAQAAMTLARQQAEKAVKHQLRAQGLKVHSFAHCEIVTMAKEYLVAHPELIAEAKPIIERWRREGFFGKRAARIVERNSQHLHKAQRPGAQALTLRETHVQNAVSTNDQQTPCGIF